MNGKRLGVGFIGSGFNARFHMQAFRAVRDADVLGVWSPNRKRAESAAELARHLDLGRTRVHTSITDLVADPAIQAIWLTGAEPRAGRKRTGDRRDHRKRKGRAQGHRV